MHKTGAWLARYALEQLGVRYTFGIPGVQNTELYDELHASERITPVLVGHEGGAAFMADGYSRLSRDVGTLVVVPAAGLTHAASGIAEAYLDGVPMLVICGGVRTDIPYRYQLHQMDLQAFMRGITKACYVIDRHDAIVPTLFEAYTVATGGEPGPVFVELPANLQLFPAEVGTLPQWQAPVPPAITSDDDIARAAALLQGAQRPGLFVGWGARQCSATVLTIAEHLQAAVATTLQGFAVVPGTHPLHAGFSFGAHAVPAARHAFADCDVLLAVGTRFAEIATGSFGAPVPQTLIHIDINPAALNANYPAKVAIAGDAATVLPRLLSVLQRLGPARPRDVAFQARIAADKKAYRQSWYDHDSGGRVNPARFFDALRASTPPDTVTVVDDGNHTYLTAELWQVETAGTGIVPTDFNAMGYAVPAALGAKLARPQAAVQCIVGDGCFRMTCMEIVTGVQCGLGVVYYVFCDGTLSQIAQAQTTVYQRTPVTTLQAVNLQALATALGAHYVALPNDDALALSMAEAQRVAAGGRPVIVEVAIDYSKRTAFTEGVVRTNFQRLTLTQKARMARRILVRKLFG